MTRKERGEVIARLHAALLEHEPVAILKNSFRVVEEGAWRSFIHPMNGMPKKYNADEFSKFCDEQLGVRPERLYEAARMFPADQARLRAEIEELAGRPVGSNQFSEDHYNIMKLQGTRSSYGYRRLKNEGRTDLLQRVDAGEMSVNAAAIKAGHRRPTASVFVDTPEAAIAGLLRRFEKPELLKALKEAPDG